MMVVPGSIPKMMRSLAISQDEKPAKITEIGEPLPAIVDFAVTKSRKFTMELAHFIY